MSKLQIRTAECFVPLLAPSRYKGAWGGRGSGKSHFFAELILDEAVRSHTDRGTGLRVACIREVQKSLKDSAKRLIEDKIKQFGLGEAQGFRVYTDRIELPNDGVITFTGMKDHNADSVKSMEGVHRAWVEEAQSLSDRSLTLLRPTIRSPGSELWFSWNPDRPTDAVDRMLRGSEIPAGAVVVSANWNQNPWFPDVLEQERQDDLRMRPERYPHIWEGEYATVLEGAYYAQALTVAEQEGRISFFNRDNLLSTYAFWDIGSSSDTADAVAVWIAQFVGHEIRILDYYEAQGQEFSYHVNWLCENGYGETICVLPHDGKKHDVVYKITPRGFLQEAGFDVRLVENQGKGAALLRIDASRRLFPQVRFNRDTTKAGREALGWYHEKRDEHRVIGLGPNHDWSSHAADSFGLMAVWRSVNDPGQGWGSGPIRRNLKGVA